MTNRASALLIVLVMVLVAVILANVALNLIASQSRLTHHQVSRIQAYYAAQAGLIYALEKLRLNNDPLWPATDSYTVTFCRSGCQVNDPDLPASVSQVDIIVGMPLAGISQTRPVSARATYTYTSTSP